MARLAPRTLDAELAKHFWGTPDARVRMALRLGSDALTLFHATLPAGTTREQALAIMRRNAHRGRRPSAVMRALNG